jgi:hypothetical protein
MTGAEQRARAHVLRPLVAKSLRRLDPAGLADDTDIADIEYFAISTNLSFMLAADWAPERIVAHLHDHLSKDWSIEIPEDELSEFIAELRGTVARKDARGST